MGGKNGGGATGEGYRNRSHSRQTARHCLRSITPIFRRSTYSFQSPANRFMACSLTGGGLSGSAAARKNNARRVILGLTVMQRWFIVKV